MLGFIKQFLDTNEREVAQAQKILKQINNLEPEMQERTYAQMQERIKEIKADLKPLADKVPQENRSSIKTISETNQLPKEELEIQKRLLTHMPEVYAMVREILRREFNRRHYDVQIIAGIILAQGYKLTELKTGEGKTQVFQLPLILYSLVGRGAHLVTVNDYLAKRDGEYAGFVANKLGLSVGIINSSQTSYRFADYAEVEEKLGAEAREQAEAQWGNNLADLRGHNLLNVDKQSAYNCDITVGINNEFGFDYLRDNMATSVSELSQRELYFCIVDEADSILIDEARTPLIISALPEDSDTEKYRVYADVASTFVEKEDYEIDHKTRTVILTEGGIEKAQKKLGVENVWADYSAAHHLENALKAKALFLKDDHYIVQEGEVLIVDSFTGRVMPGRRFSEGIHQAIEAKEGVSIQEESKTMATITFQNFFRLYKFLSGGSGTVMTEAEEFYKIYKLESVIVPTNRPVIREDAADVIYRDQDVKYRALAVEVAERHKTGQPILIGTTSVEKSELVSRLLDEARVPHEVLNAKYHEREAQIVAKAGEKGAVTVATNMAGRGTDIPLGDDVKELGGLAVIGTERHEARRIDNQLRGRSGRQGDPGYTRFYVALDDQIMRVLGGDLIDKMIGRFMMEDAPIELGLISRQIESAQKRVEGMNFDTRKSLVDYDDVMNRQREVYYLRRRQVLEQADAAQGIFTSDRSLTESERTALASEAMETLQGYLKAKIADEIDFIVDSHFQGDSKITDQEVRNKFVANILDLAADLHIAQMFDVSTAQLNSNLIKLVEGSKVQEVRTQLQEKFARLADIKIKEMGVDLPRVIKAIALEGMNQAWMEHLETMSDIRSGIGLQSYAQKDPLVAYKTEGFSQFEEFMQQIDANFARRILKVTKVTQAEAARMQLQTNNDQIEGQLASSSLEPANGSLDNAAIASGEAKLRRALSQAQQAGGAAQQPIRKAEKVGRNDPCPCGSGKKYKNCGLVNSEEHQRNLAAS